MRIGSKSAVSRLARFAAGRKSVERWHERSLLAMLLVYALIAVWYSVTIPPGEGVDEAAHLDYALFLKEQWQLPIQAPDQGRIDATMGHHPPLYYALAATVIAAIDTSDRDAVLLPNPHFVWSESGKQGWNVILPSPHNRFPWRGTILALHLLRFFSIALGAVTLCFVYWSVKRLFPNRQWAPLGATALVALNPSFIYMCSTVHHDVLLVMLNSAGLYWVIRYAAGAVTFSALVAVGIVTAASIMTKVSGLTLAPAIILLLLLRPASHRDWKQRLAQMLLVGGVALLLCGWWFVRNQIIYGDPLGANVYMTIFQANMRTTPFTWGLFVQEFLAQMGRTFWGAFGFMHILMPTWIQLTLWLITGIGMAGWLVVLLSWLLWRGSLPSSRKAAWLAIIFFLLSLFAFYVRIAVSTLGAGHGRYLFPAAVTIAALLTGGLNGYSRWRHQRWITLGVLCGMTLYAVTAPAYYVWPKYALAEPVSESEMNAATPVGVVFEGGIELVAAASSTPVIIPGQGLEITTYWALAPQQDASTPIPDAYVQMSLVNDKPEIVAAAEFWPELSTTPAVWGDRIIANSQRFYIPPDQASGQLLVQVEVRAGQGGKPLLPTGTASAQEPVTILRLLTLGAVTEVPATMLPVDQRQEVFAETMRLVAAPLPENVAAGKLLPVVLYWQVLDHIEQDYTIFVHVLNHQGEIVAQLDRPLGGGTSPTSTWQPGQLLQDTYPVPLPPSLPPGEYQVRLGMYTWPDLTRALVTLDNEPIGDAVIVGTFSVVGNSP